MSTATFLTRMWLRSIDATKKFGHLNESLGAPCLYQHAHVTVLAGCKVEAAPSACQQHSSTIAYLGRLRWQSSDG
jgi:hypothetical protein